MLRIGFGYDVHQLTAGRPLVLGGVNVPWPKGLAGHSDADVMLHAIMDALLGAAALGDIGAHFPDKDSQYEGCSSLLLLAQVREKLAREGYAANNVDCTLVAQRPKIMAYTAEMREKISQALGLRTEQVSVKATTTEHLGFAGREEGIACYAVCTLKALSP
jgi:2-C-methyl-D-erythritol 2,4-cyclodiphosphate synthase